MLTVVHWGREVCVCRTECSVGPVSAETLLWQKIQKYGPCDGCVYEVVFEGEKALGFEMKKHMMHMMHGNEDSMRG